MAETACSECRTLRKSSLLGRVLFRGYTFDQAWVCSFKCLQPAVRNRIKRSIEFPLIELDNQHRVKIGALLVRRGLITAEQLALALEKQQSEGGALGTQIIGLGYCTEGELTAVLSEQQGVPWVGEARLPTGLPFCTNFPRKLCRDFLVYPFDYDIKTSTIFLAARSPVKVHLVHLVRKMLGLNTRIFLVQDGSFDATFSVFINSPREGVERVLLAESAAAGLSDSLLREVRRRSVLALRLGHYDRGFWARLMRRSGWADCFLEYDLTDEFAGKGGKTLPDQTTVPA